MHINDIMWGDGILILGESRFSRICSAILGLEGLTSETIMPDNSRFYAGRKQPGLVIASYPFSSKKLPRLIKAAEESDVPIIVLAGAISEDLVLLLDRLNNAHCMLMPLDYQKFRALVKKVINGSSDRDKGYKIV